MWGGGEEGLKRGGRWPPVDVRVSTPLVLSYTIWSRQNDNIGSQFPLGLWEIVNFWSENDQSTRARI